MAIWGALATAALGGGISLFGASQAQSAQQKAARAQNRAAEQQAEARYERALDEYEIDWQSTLTNFYWEQALTEQVRKNEAIAAVDQASYGSRLIWSAAQNYNINSSALFDQYVVQEGLRRTSEYLSYQNEMGALQTQQALLGNRSAALGNQSAVIGAETDAAVARYMNSIRENASRANVLVAETENQTADLITTLTAEEMAANYRYETDLIAGILESSVGGNRSITQSGGGKAAKQGALNAVKRSLRAYAQVDISRNARQAKVGQLNSFITDVQAERLMTLAIQSEGYEEQAGYAERIGGLRQAGIRIQQQGIGIQQQDIQRQMQFQTNVYNQLTLPSFQLAQNQYMRELAGLQVQTTNQIQNALLPYRQREVFDPLGPIKGLAPTYFAPTKVYEPGGLSFGQGISSFLSGAQSFSPSLFNSTIPNAINKVLG